MLVLSLLVLAVSCEWVLFAEYGIADCEGVPYFAMIMEVDICTTFQSNDGMKIIHEDGGTFTMLGYDNTGCYGVPEVGQMGISDQCIDQGDGEHFAKFSSVSSYDDIGVLRFKYECIMYNDDCTKITGGLFTQMEGCQEENNDVFVCGGQKDCQEETNTFYLTCASNEQYVKTEDHFNSDCLDEPSFTFVYPIGDCATFQQDQHSQIIDVSVLNNTFHYRTFEDGTCSLNEKDGGNFKWGECTDYGNGERFGRFSLVYDLSGPDSNYECDIYSSDCESVIGTLYTDTEGCNATSDTFICGKSMACEEGEQVFFITCNENREDDDDDGGGDGITYNSSVASFVSSFVVSLLVL